MILQYKEIPDIVRIELTNTCHLQCPECRFHSPEKRKPENYPEYYKTPVEMTEAQVSSIIDEIAPYKPSITLNVANEPLMAKSFSHAVCQIKEKSLIGTFNTSGLLLSDKLA